MPNTTSATKKLRADMRKTKINRKINEGVKVAYKNLLSYPSKDSLSKFYSALDIALKKNVITKQKVSRKKAQAATLAKATKPKVKKVSRVRKAKSKAA